MLAYLYLAIILLMKFLQDIFTKKTSRMVDGAPAYLCYGSYRYLLSAVLAFILLLISGEGLQFSPKAIGISAIGAVALSVSFYCGLEALKSGAIVLVSLAGAAGLLIPCILGIFMFDEPMSIAQFIGIGILLVAAYLLVGYSKKLTGKFTFKTLLLLIGAMLSNGFIMVAQKMFSKFLPEEPVSIFSFLAFGISGLIMLVGFLPCLRTAENRQKIKELPRALFVIGAVLSIALLVINQLATIAGKEIPSAIMFPINDGGGMIITALTAAFVFKEKLTVRSVCGIILSIAALLVVSLL